MTCTQISVTGATNVSDMLTQVDCATGRATAAAFDHLFGVHGALATALTAILTIYVALLAFNLLTGRSGLSLSLLTPRALGIGLVLTFATSWVAYQQVVWNLAAGAPDQVAGLLIGSRGSAVHLFAGQLDKLFAAVSDAAQANVAAMDAAKKTAAVSPSDLLWFSAMLLLLGTAGVLVVARIALAALLAVGPVFIVLALFGATRGLFEGWLKAVVMFALMPLLTVLVGGGALLLLGPMVQALDLAGNAVSLQMATGVFLGACVYCALMVMVTKAASVLTGHWRLPRDVPASENRPPVSAAVTQNQHLTATREDARIRQLVTAIRLPAAAAPRFAQTARTFAPTPGEIRSAVSAGGGLERVRGLGTLSRKEASQ